MAEHITVRMYDVGFGDAFILEFPRPGEPAPFRVLVDCGAHSSGYPRDGWRPEDVVDMIIADVDHGAGPAIDVVIATHRHQDHVSGFRAAAWAKVDVGEVWMPWTEHPTDPQAAAIRNRQSRLALGLDTALRLRLDGGADDERLRDLLDLVGNSLTNEAAMRTLHSGFRHVRRRRFLATDGPAGSDGAEPIRPEGCPGLTVHVLGPSHDEDVIRDMDPPAGQSYLRHAAAPGDMAGTRELVAFARNFGFDQQRFAAQWPSLALEPKIQQVAAAMTREDDLAAAVSLDKAVNGTSLMLVFEFGDAVLLFPGDAQWGTWQAAMAHPPSRALLERTTFLKVGHHGSHNATPRDLLERVMDGHTMWGAAASVHPIPRWPEIPKLELLDRLEQKSQRVRRSDEPGADEPGVQVLAGRGIEFAVPFEAD